MMIRNILNHFSLIFIIGSFSCTGDSSTPENKVLVTDITLNNRVINLRVGKKESLVATIVPSNSTNKGVTWISSNEFVVKVSNTGEVTAIGSGEATIIAISRGNSNKIITATVKVATAVTGVILDKNTLNLKAGDSNTLVARVLPSNATNKDIIWTSSNSSTVRVSNTGEVIAAKVGIATIIATSVDDKTKRDITIVGVVSGATKPGSPATLTSTIKKDAPKTVVLGWTAPSNPGKAEDGVRAATITDYEITVNPPVSGVVKPIIVSNSEGLRKEISGLTLGETYTFTVKAKNIAGLGSGKDTQKSIASSLSAPQKPTNLVATTGITTTSIPLTWTTPINNGNNNDGTRSSIKEYTVSYSTGSTTQTKKVINERATIIGLTSGTSYTITVNATNTAGETSGSSNEIIVTTISAATKPNPPTNLVAKTGITTTSIPLTWTTPINSGNNNDGTRSSIKEYTVSYSTGSTTQTKKVTNEVITLMGLTSGASYTITVNATNTAGETSGSSNEIIATTISAATKPTPPTNLAATTGITMTTIPLTWTAPSDNGKNDDNTESSIKSYTISYTSRLTTKTKTITATGTQALVTSTTLTSLTPFTQYTITVTTTNTTGKTSESSNQITSTTASGALKSSAPTELVAIFESRTTTSIALKWLSPTYNGRNANGTASAIIKYTITYTDKTVSKTKILTGVENQTPANNIILTGLMPKTQYTITVSATNTANLESDSSNKIISFTKESPPPIEDGLSALVYRISQSTTKTIPPQADIDRIEIAKIIFKGLKPSIGARVELRYVKTNGVDTNNGESWSTAKKDIKTTLDEITDASANKIYLLLIGSGTYTPKTTLSMKNYVAIIGGFEASSDVAKGYYNGVTTEISGANAMQQVFYNHGLDVTNAPSTAILARITITNGYSSNNGGGMDNNSSSPTITQVTFSNNKAGGNGGGMNNSNSSPIMTQVIFSSNFADYGGGINNNNSSPIITRVTLSSNSSIKNGGGVNNNNSLPTITQVTFSNNKAGGNGGGMNNSNTSSPIITKVTFSNNSANNSGGGMSNNNSSPIVTKATFSNNSAKYGGGIMNSANSSPIVIGVTFSNNSATDNGGGMLNEESSPIVIGVTFSNNSATNNGGGMFNFLRTASLPTISSSIFWGNTKGLGLTKIFNQIDNNGPAALPSHSVIQGDTENSTRGIIVNNPELRVLDYNGGFVWTMAIGTTSPAKDKGLYFARKGKINYYSSDNTTWYTTPLLTTGTSIALPSDAVSYFTDARGYGYNNRPDMGAYEYSGTAP